MNFGASIVLQSIRLSIILQSAENEQLYKKLYFGGFTVVEFSFYSTGNTVIRDKLVTSSYKTFSYQ